MTRMSGSCEGMPCSTPEDIAAIQADIATAQQNVALAQAVDVVYGDLLTAAQSNKMQAESNLMTAQMALSDFQMELSDAQSNACPA